MFEGSLVLVTGGTGMIGSHLIEELQKVGAEVRTVVHERPLPSEIEGIETVEGDLRRLKDCREAAKDVRYVFHLAAFVGGVGRNATRPAGMFTPNILMNTNMLEAARLEEVDRYLFTSSACVYPGDLMLFVEDRGWDGPPEPSNASYGWVKRMGEFQAKAYRDEYGMEIAVVRPTNAYGSRDNFDLETSHVIPALIRKAISRQNPLVVWGSGEATRDFIHARDVARGMLLVLEQYPSADPLNLATGKSIKIRDLARMILDLSGRKGAEIRLDTSKPTGQKIRSVDVSKAEKKVGFKAEIPLEEGLRETISWYKVHKGRIAE